MRWCPPLGEPCAGCTWPPVSTLFRRRTLVVIVLWLSVLLWALVEVVSLSSTPKLPDFSGTVLADDPVHYGFGEKKRLVVIDLSLIGDVDKIHDDDKKPASIAYYENDVQLFDASIGIELKGRGFDQYRYKLNYAFEFHACEENDVPDSECPEWDGKDLGDVLEIGEMSGDFGAMGNFEDYVLRGEDGDPSFTRGDIGAALGPIPYNTTLVEVLFKINHKYTYEGVYILQPNVKKRDVFYTNNYALSDTVWSDDGKMPKCQSGGDVDPTDQFDQQVTNYEEIGGLVFEYSLHGSPRDTYCVVADQDYQIEMGYPKCSKINAKDECRTARRNWVAQYAKLTDATSLPSHVHVEDFVDTMLLELVLLRLDFGFSSVFFHVPPGGKQPLLPGPIYDCDGGSWRYRDLYRDPKSLTLTTIKFQTMPLYKTLLADPTLNELLRVNGPSTLDTYKIVIDNIIDTRIQQESLGYFNRNSKRWPFYGKYYIPAFENWEHAFPEGVTKPTMKEELVFVKTWFHNRITYLQEMLPNTHSIPVVQHVFFPPRHIAFFTWTGIVILITILYIIALIIKYTRTPRSDSNKPHSNKPHTKRPPAKYYAPPTDQLRVHRV